MSYVFNIMILVAKIQLNNLLKCNLLQLTEDRIFQDFMYVLPQHNSKGKKQL